MASALVGTTGSPSQLLSTNNMNHGEVLRDSCLESFITQSLCASGLVGFAAFSSYYVI